MTFDTRNIVLGLKIEQEWDAGTGGASYIALEAEEEPIVRRIFLPNCALVSPAHRLEADESAPGEWRIYDDPDYPSDPLTDEQFAERLP